MNDILGSKQYRDFQQYLKRHNAKHFLAVGESDAVVVQGDLETGRKGLKMMEKTTRRESKEWIPKSDPINCPKSCEDGEQF